MSSKKYAVSFLLLSLVLAAAIAGMNIVVDPFGVFGVGFVANYDVNPRYTKLNQIIKHKNEYNALIMGTCLSSNMDPDFLDKLFGLHFFNLSVHNFVPNEPPVFLKILIENNVKIKVVFVNLENYLDSSGAAIPDTQDEQTYSVLSSRWPPFITKKSWAEFFIPYVFCWNTCKASLKSILDTVKGVAPPIVEYKNGYWDWQHDEISMKIDKKDHILRHHIASAWSSNLALKTCPDLPVPAVNSSSALTHLQRLVQLAKEHNIAVVGFLPPTWITRNACRWKGRASEWFTRSFVDILGSFYDFTLFNAWTMNPANFLNRENLCPEMAEEMSRLLVGDSPSLRVVKVDANNIDTYEALKRSQQTIFHKEMLPILKSTPYKKWIDIDYSSIGNAIEAATHNEIVNCKKN